MLPDISNRINNLIKAMEKTIAPAIGDENGLAQEQAALVIGHLKMLDQQWDKAFLFEKGSLKTMRTLAEQLLDCAAGGSETNSASTMLKTSLASIPSTLPHTANAVNQYTIAVGNCIDALIDACYNDGAIEFKNKILNITLNYGSTQSFRERVWFSGTNLDPDKNQLISIDELLATDQQD